MVPVRKSNGSIRLCIDFRALNEVTVPDPYQMPNIEDLLDKVSDIASNCRGFSLYQSVPHGFTTGLLSVQEATVYLTPTFVLEVP